MTIRRTIFWLHLIAGIIAGLSIAVMCFTGVTLAFEKQLVAWSERDARQIEPLVGAASPLPVDELIRRVREAEPDATPASVTVASDPRSAVAVSLGRDNTVFANPYTGAVRRPASTRMHDFLHVMEDWHRFLALTGDHRPTGKLINGICNLAFFVLAATGLYLWIPRRWSWRSMRGVVWFQRGLAGKPRDFNWHNVIGLWSAPVLIVLTLTAVPISFRWGNALVYRLVGEEPPARQGPPGSGSPAVDLPAPTAGARPLSRDAQFAAVRAAFPEWEQITLRLNVPGSGAPGARTPSSAPARRPDAAALAAEPPTFLVKTPGAWPRTATTAVTLNPFTGDVIRCEAFSDQSAGRRLRSWTRFLHTGEALGWAGQLAAGAASLGGCFLVYTGLALSWRRFFGKRGAKTPAAAS